MEPRAAARARAFDPLVSKGVERNEEGLAIAVSRETGDELTDPRAVSRARPSARPFCRALRESTVVLVVRNQR